MIAMSNKELNEIIIKTQVNQHIVDRGESKPVTGIKVVGDDIFICTEDEDININYCYVCRDGIPRVSDSHR